MFTEYTAELAYSLGFIWGDGTLNRKSNVVIEIVKVDLTNILPIFEKCFKCVYSERSRPNRQPQATIRINDGKFVNFLIEHGYIPNRSTSPESIINLIPKDLQKFWYLGFLDADGSWYFNEKRKLKQFSFSGNKNQDWNFVEILFTKLNMTYSKQVRIFKKSACSEIRAFGKDNLKNFGNYLYEGHNLGLKRKREKYKLIIN